MLDYFRKVDPDLKNTVEWIIPNAQRNMMEPIRLTMEPGGSVYPDLPHEGEEFGYVLSGTVTIHIGSRHYRAKKGESFYFSPSKQHFLENTGRRQRLSSGSAHRQAFRVKNQHT